MEINKLCTIKELLEQNRVLLEIVEDVAREHYSHTSGLAEGEWVVIIVGDHNINFYRFDCTSDLMAYHTALSMHRAKGGRISRDVLIFVNSYYNGDIHTVVHSRRGVAIQ